MWYKTGWKPLKFYQWNWPENNIVLWNRRVKFIHGFLDSLYRSKNIVKCEKPLNENRMQFFLDKFFFVDIYCRSVLVGFITAALWTTCLAESDMESSQIFPLKKVENGQNSKQAGRRCGHNSSRADIRAAPNERRISIGLFSRWNITRKQGQLQDASICFTETTRSQRLKIVQFKNEFI